MTGRVCLPVPAPVVRRGLPRAQREERTRRDTGAGFGGLSAETRASGSEMSHFPGPQCVVRAATGLRGGEAR